MLRLLFVRHGQSESNVAMRFTGQTDVPLSELGRKQANELKEFILNNYNVDSVWSSDLLRARETVMPIAEALHLPIRREKLLREIDGGKWENKTFEEIKREFPADFAMWHDQIGLACCTGGESLAQLQQRALSAVEKIVSVEEKEEKEKDGARTVLIATHAALLRTLQCAWMGVTLREMQNVAWVPNASVTEVTFEDGKFTLVKAGRADFLQGDITRIRNF